MSALKALVGQTLSSVHVNVDAFNDAILFVTNSGRTFKMFHYQDCCEDVFVEDINGDLHDLVGSSILFADEQSNEAETPDVEDENYKREKWTFYRLGTIKGTVVIRWHGVSNGYYSESVDVVEVQP